MDTQGVLENCPVVWESPHMLELGCRIIADLFMMELPLSAGIRPFYKPQFPHGTDWEQTWQGRAVSRGPRRGQNPGLPPPSPAAQGTSVEKARARTVLRIPEKTFVKTKGKLTR